VDGVEGDFPRIGPWRSAVSILPQRVEAGGGTLQGFSPSFHRAGPHLARMRGKRNGLP